MDDSTDTVMEAAPSWRVLEFSFSEDTTDSELVMMYDHRRFVIRLCADDFAASPLIQRRYIFFLGVAENVELAGFTVEDFYEWVAEPMLPVFNDLPRMQIDGRLTLQQFLYAQTSIYTLRGYGDEVVAVEDVEGEPAPPCFGVCLSNAEAILAEWPVFDPSDIQIFEDKNKFRLSSITPRKVLLNNGTVAFLKLIRPGDESSLLREIDTYSKINHAPLDKGLRISRLLGLAADEDDKVFGLLLTYIDCERKTLSCVVKPETPKHFRQQWLSQIDFTAAQLHDAGIVWGDAKPDNILIDGNMDAWLVDFGGGYTDGWVPKELVGTMEGDLHGLGKITDFVEHTIM